MKSILSILIASLLMAGSALATDQISGLWSKQQFEQNRTTITKDLADTGGKYHEISPDDQKKVEQTLDGMEQRWQAAGDAPLTQAQQVEMSNDQEVVVTLLSHAEADSRVKCERVREIGSNLPKNVCKTMAERKREMKAAQDAVRQGKETN